MRSLLLVVRVTGAPEPLATATGFVVVHGGRYYLVTNWHVVSGRRLDTGQPLSPTGAIPDTLEIVHNAANQFGVWASRQEPLYDAAHAPLWLEHPDHGRRVDLVALPLTQLDGVALYEYDPANPGPLITYGPSENVSVIGFPFGVTAGGVTAIWTQGAVASEPGIDFGNLPRFLIDSRSRPGQSGSPVLVYRVGTFSDEAGGTHVISGAAERFVGVYSGRISPDSDLGFVWKTQALIEVLSGQTRGATPTLSPS